MLENETKMKGIKLDTFSLEYLNGYRTDGLLLSVDWSYDETGCIFRSILVVNPLQIPIILYNLSTAMGLMTWCTSDMTTEAALVFAMSERNGGVASRAEYLATEKHPYFSKPIGL